MTSSNGRHISVGDVRLYVESRGQGYPILVLHGGPGLDHHMFGDYLDSLTDEFTLILVDQRGHGRSDRASDATWTLERHAADVSALAAAMALKDYAVLGHSFGAFVALDHAVRFPGAAAQTIISGGLPSTRFLDA